MKTTIMFVLVIFVLWILYSVAHSTRNDLTVMGVDDYDTAENAAVLYAPSGIRSTKIVQSKSMRTTYCVWYIEYYEVPDFIWEEMKKRGKLKCD